MMFLANFGIGLLANMIGQASMQRQSEQLAKQFRTGLNDSAKLARQQLNDPFGRLPFALDFSTPPPPDKAQEALTQRQQSNCDERQQLTSTMHDELAQARDEFFTENHLDTRQQDGKQRVALGPDGKPVVTKGPETPEQKVARQTFEGEQRESLATKHDTEKQQFTQHERENLLTFLQNNKPDLGNPAVQGELQKMIMLSHKKALDVARRQEEEGLKLDLYTEDQVALADKKLGDLRQLEDKHAFEEDNSPEAQELLGYQQDLAELLRQKREEAKEQNQQEMFLKGPPRFGQATADKEVDVAEVLPPYLSNALYNMGIMTV